MILYIWRWDVEKQRNLSGRNCIRQSLRKINTTNIEIISDRIIRINEIYRDKKKIFQTKKKLSIVARGKQITAIIMIIISHVRVKNQQETECLKRLSSRTPRRGVSWVTLIGRNNLEFAQNKYAEDSRWSIVVIVKNITVNR